jgi:hypothetical protein
MVTPFKRIQFNRPVFEVNKKLSFENEEKFIIVIMLMPMVFSFNDSKADNTVIYLLSMFD